MSKYIIGTLVVLLAQFSTGASASCLKTPIWDTYTSYLSKFREDKKTRYGEGAYSLKATKLTQFDGYSNISSYLTKNGRIFINKRTRSIVYYAGYRSNEPSRFNLVINKEVERKDVKNSNMSILPHSYIEFRFDKEPSKSSAQEIISIINSENSDIAHKTTQRYRKNIKYISKRTKTPMDVYGGYGFVLEYLETSMHLPDAEVLKFANNPNYYVSAGTSVEILDGALCNLSLKKRFLTIHINIMSMWEAAVYGRSSL